MASGAEGIPNITAYNAPKTTASTIAPRQIKNLARDTALDFNLSMPNILWFNGKSWKRLNNARRAQKRSSNSTETLEIGYTKSRKSRNFSPFQHGQRPPTPTCTSPENFRTPPAPLWQSPARIRPPYGRGFALPWIK